MKRYNLLLLALILTMSASAQSPRLLITTDIGGDPDDQQSLVRLMVYTNEFDIEGISNLIQANRFDFKIVIA